MKISNAVYTPQYLNNEINTSINHPFTFEEVNHAIKKRRKNSGVDYIINEYVKYSPEFMIHEIVHFRHRYCTVRMEYRPHISNLCIKKRRHKEP